jgi:hypothetical protein
MLLLRMFVKSIWVDLRSAFQFFFDCKYLDDTTPSSYRSYCRLPGLSADCKLYFPNIPGKTCSDLLFIQKLRFPYLDFLPLSSGLSGFTRRAGTGKPPKYNLPQEPFCSSASTLSHHNTTSQQSSTSKIHILPSLTATSALPQQVSTSNPPRPSCRREFLPGREHIKQVVGR